MESLQIFQRLHHAGARYVLVGAMALVFQGVEVAFTHDVDLAISLAAQDRDAVLTALRDVHPVPPRARVAPPWDEFSLRAPWTKVHTDLGEIDFLVTLPGVEGGFEGLYGRSEVFEAGGVPVRLACLEDLAAMKGASTRQKDGEHLEAIRSFQRELAERGVSGAQ